MKRFSEQFKKKSESIRLRASERADLRDRITAYMEYHPLPAEMKVPKQTPVQKYAQGIASEPFKIISLNMTYIRGFAGVFAVFMVVGIPLIAERAVPGDVLYPVKTQITEEVRATLTLSPYAKIEWETERLQRRVAEARLLASEGKFTPEAEAIVAQAVQEHTDAANKEIATIRETNEDEASLAEIAFASAMEVQSEVLEGHIKKEPALTASSEAGRSVAALAGVVNGVRDNAAVAQAGSVPSYEGLIGRVESQTTRAYELFKSVQDYASGEETANIERRLEDIERKIIEAVTLHNGNALVTEEVPVEIQEQPVEEETTVETEGVTQEMSSSTDTSSSSTTPVPEEEVEVKASSTDVSKEEELSETVGLTEEQSKVVIELLRVALMDVQKLISFMTDIDVRENVSIDELVPVTLTVEERTQAVNDQLNTITVIQTDIAQRILTEALEEEIVDVIVDIDSKAVSIKEALTAGEIVVAESIASTTLAIALEVQTIVADLPLKEVEEEAEAATEVPVETEVESDTTQ